MGERSSQAQVIQSQIDLCQIFVTDKIAGVPNLCKDVTALKKQLSSLQAAAPSPGIPSENWDATPEGTFSEAFYAPIMFAEPEGAREPADFNTSLSDLSDWNLQRWKAFILETLSRLPNKTEFTKLENKTLETIAAVVS